MKLIFFLILSLFIVSCDQSKSIETTSQNFGSQSEKTKFLKDYIKLEQENFVELDFYINYQDNSTGMVPAPNDWGVYIIARVEDIHPWINNKEKLKSKPKDLDLKKVKTNINYSKISEWFSFGQDDYIGIDRQNKIIVYINQTY